MVNNKVDQIDKMVEGKISDISNLLMSIAFHAMNHEYNKAVNVVDDAEITLMQIRNALVSIIHNSEVEG